MTIRLRGMLYDLEIRPWHEVEFETRRRAPDVSPLRGLHRARNDPAAMALLRRLVARSCWLTPVDRFSDEEVIECLTRQVEAGRIYLIPGRRASSGSTAGGDGEGNHQGASPGGNAEASRGRSIPGGSTNRRTRAERLPDAPPLVPDPVPHPGEHWITIRLIDEATGAALSGVSLRIRSPDGSTITRATGADGAVLFASLAAGTADLEEIVDASALEVIEIQSGGC